MLVLNDARIDWLTMTTWSNATATTWAERTFADGATMKPAARAPGYHGVSADRVFIGQRIQRGQMHHLLEISGEKAHESFWILPRDQGKCTRLDLQVTVRIPPAFSAASLYHELLAARWSGRKRAVTLIASGNGLDTVYIGRRTSHRYTRVYVKTSSRNGPPAYLRFEVEFKGSAADFIASSLDHHAEICRWLAGELAVMPSPMLKDMFSESLGCEALRLPVERLAEEHATMRWLRDAVEPSVMRLAHSHEHRSEALAWLENLLAHCE